MKFIFSLLTVSEEGDEDDEGDDDDDDEDGESDEEDNGDVSLSEVINLNYNLGESLYNLLGYPL